MPSTPACFWTSATACGGCSTASWSAAARVHVRHARDGRGGAQHTGNLGRLATAARPMTAALPAAIMAVGLLLAPQLAQAQGAPKCPGVRRREGVRSVVHTQLAATCQIVFDTFRALDKEMLQTFTGIGAAPHSPLYWNRAFCYSAWVGVKESVVRTHVRRVPHGPPEALQNCRVPLAAPVIGSEVACRVDVSDYNNHPTRHWDRPPTPLPTHQY